MRRRGQHGAAKGALRDRRSRMNGLRTKTSMVVDQATNNRVNATVRCFTATTKKAKETIAALPKAEG